MPTALKSWLEKTALTDPLQKQQAAMLQILLLVLISVLFLSLPLVVLTSSTPLTQLITALSSIQLMLLSGAALVTFRRGYFDRAIFLIVTGFLLGQTFSLLGTGLGNSAVILMYALPISLVGLLAGRRVLLVTLGLSILTLFIGDIGYQWSRPFLNTTPPPTHGVAIVGVIAIILGLLAVLLDRFGVALREALYVSQAREQELAQMQASLEQQVADRTQALQMALTEGQQREAALVQALAQNEQQQQTIRSLSTPLLPIRDQTLVIPLVGVLDDERLENLQSQALHALEGQRIYQLVLDITGVPFIDSRVAHGLIQVVEAARLLGAEVILVGIHPEVAQSLVSLGITLKGMRTFSTLQTALRVIEHGRKQV